MKIKFYRKMWWKLLIYYLLLMSLTLGITIWGTSHRFRKMLENDRQFDMISRVNKAAKILSERDSENYSEKELIKDFNKTARITGITMHLLNPEGKELSKQISRATRFEGTPRHFSLSDSEMARIKKGESFNFKKNSSIADRRFLYIVSPVIFKGNLIASIVATGPIGPPRRFNRVFYDSVGIASLLALIIAIFFSQWFTKPISKMEQAAKSIAEGDFSQKLNINRKDELGVLAAAFDDMSRRIKKNIENRMKLMGDISHELNTPLTTIQASTEAMIDGMAPTEKERDKYLNSILRQTRRLSFLINDITELSKFEAGVVKLNKTDFNVSEVLNQAYESIDIIAKHKNKKLSIIFDDDNTKAEGDPQRILQVLLNLTSNAIHHTKEDTEVEIHALTEKETVLFKVRDNGQGIPPDQLENVFNRFYKVDKARTQNDSGSGLGLAIVSEILEAHGQKIKVESSPEGTSFSFRLPKA